MQLADDLYMSVSADFWNDLFHLSYGHRDFMDVRATDKTSKARPSTHRMPPFIGVRIDFC